MKDYIKREDALKWCRPEEWDTPDERWRPESEYGKMIKALPAAEVEERKTGKWVSINEYLNHLQNKTGEQYVPSSLYNATPFCNQCWASHDRKSNFCPNCGAKMEG